MNQSEDAFSNAVLAYFREKLRESRWIGISVVAKANILDNFTIGKGKNGQWKAILSAQNQDIVFYADVLPEAAFGAPAMHVPSRGQQFGRTKGVIVPLVILELKVPQSMNTHQLITYSHIASRIRLVFPHCAYYFVLSTNKTRRLEPETVLRQAKGFDRVFLEWEQDKEIIWEDIDKHFSYLVRLGIISKRK